MIIRIQTEPKVRIRTTELANVVNPKSSRFSPRFNTEGDKREKRIAQHTQRQHNYHTIAIENNHGVVVPSSTIATSPSNQPLPVTAQPTVSPLYRKRSGSSLLPSVFSSSLSPSLPPPIDTTSSLLRHLPSLGSVSLITQNNLQPTQPTMSLLHGRLGSPLLPSVSLPSNLSSPETAHLSSVITSSCPCMSPQPLHLQRHILHIVPQPSHRQ